MITPIKDIESFRKALKSSKPVVAGFNHPAYPDWQTTVNTITQVSEKYGDKIECIMVDGYNGSDILGEYEIIIPAVVSFVGGEKTTSTQGGGPREVMEQIVEAQKHI